MAQELVARNVVVGPSLISSLYSICMYVCMQEVKEEKITKEKEREKWGRDKTSWK